MFNVNNDEMHVKTLVHVARDNIVQRSPKFNLVPAGPRYSKGYWIEANKNIIIYNKKLYFINQ